MESSSALFAAQNFLLQKQSMIQAAAGQLFLGQPQLIL
jgi:hypothetical protein